MVCTRETTREEQSEEPGEDISAGLWSGEGKAVAEGDAIAGL